MSTENIVTGKFYRILKDKTNDIWDRISLWTHSDDVETASGITLTNDLTTKDNKITATQNDFGTVETSSVSAHAYVKGNLLLYNNQLYRAKTAIAVGATLTEGTNIESVSVGTLSNMLTATNGNQFYFDVKDDTPGFYPSASKTASEFVPFGGTTRGEYHEFTIPAQASTTPGTYIADLGYKPKILLMQVQATQTGVITEGVPLWIHYDESISTTQYYYSYQTTHAMYNLGTQLMGLWTISLTNTGFTVTSGYYNYLNVGWYCAVKN